MKGNVIRKKSEKPYAEKDGCFVFRDGRIFKVCKKTNRFGKKGQMKEVKQSDNGCGYLFFRINGETVYSHRFIWEAFFGSIPEGMQINHRDENKSNNHIENLELCDCTYNNNYGTRNEKVANVLSKPINQYTKEETLVKTYPSLMEAARQTGFVQGNISKCCNRKLKSAYGYIWRYVEE